jgi:tRNA (guanine10-N2)-dimethyltransferase
VAELFFLLSGEHRNLPASELKAILEAEGFAYEVSEKLDQVIRLKAEPGCTEAVKRRAALTRVCASELFSCEAEMSTIIRNMRAISLDEALAKKESFAVRVKRVRSYASKIREMTLERTLGQLIIDKNPGACVNLKKPDKTFMGILTDNKFTFGVKLAEIPAKPFVERRPRRRPFFHPSAMQAKLARCMVNLAKPRVGDLVFDPFCGTGTMLIEASLIGCRALGIDIQRRMARGTIRNLSHFKIRPEGIIVADMRSPPLKKVDCVVTDPPYGISSTTLKRTTKQIVEELLMAINEMLSKGQQVCMASPRTLKIGQIGTMLGYKHLESHFVYVHRSLTREIVVFEKV